MIHALVAVVKNTNNAAGSKWQYQRRFDMSERGKGEFWAFAAGLLAGGVVALLYAPAKGEETRKRIKDGAEETYQKGEEIYGKGRVEAEKIYQDGREKVEKIYSDGRAKVEETIDYVRDKVHADEEVEAETETDPKA